MEDLCPEPTVPSDHRGTHRGKELPLFITASSYCSSPSNFQDILKHLVYNQKLKTRTLKNKVIHGKNQKVAMPAKKRHRVIRELEELTFTPQAGNQLRDSMQLQRSIMQNKQTRANPREGGESDFQSYHIIKMSSFQQKLQKHTKK